MLRSLSLRVTFQFILLNSTISVHSEALTCRYPKHKKAYPKVKNLSVSHVHALVILAPDK